MGDNMMKFWSNRQTDRTSDSSTGFIEGREPRGSFRVVAAAIAILCVGHWASAASKTGSRRTSAAPSPCDLALTPHEGSAEIDRLVQRLQKRLSAQKMLSADPTKTIGTRAGTAAARERLGWAFVAKARESLDPGYYVMADWCARCIAERDPNSAEALLLAGHIHHSLHRFRAAEEVARKLVRQRGDWFDHGLLGDALMEMGRLDEAATHYQHMMDVRPGPQSYSRASHLRWLRGDLAGAIELMEMAVRAISPRSRESAAWMHARLAQYLLQSGTIEKAERTVDRALSIFPDYPPALLTLGRIRLARSDFAAALPALRTAADANPLPDYQWALLDALEQTGRRAEAHEVRQKLLRSGAANDGRTTALYLATARLSVEEALRLARAELQQRQDVHSHDALAWALAANGEYAAAEIAARSALAEGTRDPRMFLHAGIIAEKRGNLAEATALLSKAASFDDTLLPSEHRQLDESRARLGRHPAG
jgi:tetratricopeptide (TPR) repeat protein